MSSLITIFSNTVTTTNSNLDGALTAVQLMQLPPGGVPSFAELPQY